jgi:hypothetical protein
MELSLKLLPGMVLYKLNDLFKEKDIELISGLAQSMRAVNIPFVLIVSNKEIEEVVNHLGNVDHIILSSLTSVEIATYLTKLLILYIGQESFSNSQYSYENETLKLKVPAKLVRIGEVSCAIASPMVIPMQDKINLESEFIKDISLKFYDLNRINADIHYGQNGHVTEYNIRAIPESSAKSIRGNRNRWKV